MARGQGGVAGVEVALIATARCTAQAKSAHQRRCHPEHMARRTRDGVRRDRAVSKMRMREKQSRLQRPPRFGAEDKASRPVRWQAVAWSPKGSEGAPQPYPLSPPQWREARGKGRRRRRRKATCISSGDKVVPGSVGMAVSHAAAWGPDWERRRACSASGRGGITSRALCTV